MTDNYGRIINSVKANLAEGSRLESLLRKAVMAQNWAVVERTERRLEQLKAVA